VSLEFLCVAQAEQGGRFAPVARSPMERLELAAGARFELRDGWNVVVSYGLAEQEAEALSRAAAWADFSHLGKLEFQAAPSDPDALVPAATEPGRAAPVARAAAPVAPATTYARVAQTTTTPPAQIALWKWRWVIGGRQHLCRVRSRVGLRGL